MSLYEFKNVINIPFQNIELEGELVIPIDSKSVVIFSHGSGSSRFSSRNNFVAKVLQERGISTFLIDLLTKEEDEIYSNRFNIELLTQRLIHVTKYIELIQQSKKLKIGYFGASTGAASALNAAVRLPETIHAIVSRGGRRDLMIDVIDEVKAPTLLIVGSLDNVVIDLNQKAYDALKCIKSISIVNGATHLFEEFGALNKVALLATDWFSTYL